MSGNGGFDERSPEAALDSMLAVFVGGYAGLGSPCVPRVWSWGFVVGCAARSAAEGGELEQGG